MKKNAIIKDILKDNKRNNILSKAKEWIDSIEPVGKKAVQDIKKEFEDFNNDDSRSTDELKKWVKDKLAPLLEACKTKKRHYNISKLPIINIKTVNNSNKKREILIELYGEINSNYRNLADIRFKLLGFVPAISALAWIQLIKELPPNCKANTIVGLIISAIILLITYGVRMYDIRNNELYDDLVSRGRRLENELGIRTGIFKGRLEANKCYLWCYKVNHGNALSFIYFSVFIGWILLFSWYLINMYYLITAIAN